MYCFLIVHLEKVVFKESLEKWNAKEIENYEPIQVSTLLERFYAEMKIKHG